MAEFIVHWPNDPKAIIYRLFITWSSTRSRNAEAIAQDSRLDAIEVASFQDASARYNRTICIWCMMALETIVCI